MIYLSRSLGASVSCGKPRRLRRRDAPSREDQSPLDTRLRRDTPLPCGADGGFLLSLIVNDIFVPLPTGHPGAVLLPLRLFPGDVLGSDVLAQGRHHQPVLLHGDEGLLQ